MRSIAALARETSAETDQWLTPGDDDEDLQKPFLFVVIGEVNAGKSTLINGLFGRELCRTNVLPETSKVLHYRHAPAAADEDLAPTHRVCHRPLDFLRDFQVVDTPGTNHSAAPAHLQAIAGILPAADLILVIFPVSNPWGAATWDTAGRIPAHCLHRTVFIIQQADQRNPADVAVILGHMRDLSMKRLGRVPPMFAVSAKLACEAKRMPPVDQANLSASGFRDLEAYISRNVCESPDRERLLKHWHSRIAAAMHAIEGRIEEQSRALDARGRFLEQVEDEIDRMRERFVVCLPQHLAAVAEVFESDAVWAAKVLGRWLGAARSIYRLFVGDRSGQKIEALFIGRLQAAVEAVARKDSAEVLAACRDHWSGLGVRVRKATGVNLGGSGPLEGMLANTGSRFVTRLGGAACEGIGNLKVRHQLDKDLRRRNLALKSFTFTTLTMVTIGATLGALGVPWLPFVFIGAAAAFLIGGIIAAWTTRRAIIRDFQGRLLDTCGTFASTLSWDYEEALRVVFQDYADTLAAVRKHIAMEKSALEPRANRWQELFLTVKAIEQEL